MSKLFSKLALIQASLRSIPETGHNKFHGYSYARAEDIINAVRPICSSHGIFLTISCIEHQILNDGKAASVIVALTATDCETGESTICTMPGYAEDAKSDKSLWKAMTGATKYVLRSFFCLASTDDPEDEDTEPAPNKSATSNPTNNNSKAKPPQPPAGTSGRIAVHKPIPAPAVREQPPQKQAAPTPLSVNAHPPVAVDLISQALPPMEESMEQMRRVGWTNAQGRLFLQENFGVATRKELTPPQLQQFLKHLRAVGGKPASPASLPDALPQVPVPT